MRHPPHNAVVLLSGRIVTPAKPLRTPSPWLRWQRERACHRNGGHWWHPYGGMIDWFCCSCGKETSGMPRDGGVR